jgi:hypothetical protein
MMDGMQSSSSQLKLSADTMKLWPVPVPIPLSSTEAYLYLTYLTPLRHHLPTSRSTTPNPCLTWNLSAAPDVT